MTRLDAILLGVSLAVIAAIFVTEAVRARRGLSARLSPPMTHALRISLGIFFLILGVIGGFVPVMQGWMFILLGILVLFPESKFAVKTLDKVEKKMPRLVARLRKWGIGIHRERPTA